MRPGSLAVWCTAATTQPRVLDLLEVVSLDSMARLLNLISI